MRGRLIVAVLLLLGGAGRARAGDWQVDPDAAARTAAAERRDVFLLFTGTAWCGACVRLDDQILSKPEFAAGTGAFVRVKLEFPAAADQLPADRRGQYIAWRDRCGIRAYPTVLLTDPDGRPYAITGLDSMDETPDHFVRKVDDLRQVRTRRDAALDRARHAAGLDRARALDEALAAVRGASEPSTGQDQGELVVRSYRPEIDEVIALDPSNAAGLRDRYRALLATDDERARLGRAADEVSRILQAQGPEAALACCDAALAQAPSADFRAHLVVSKLNVLEAARRFEEARRLAEDLAADPSRPIAERRNLRIKAAYELIQLDRADEAIAVYDQLIAGAAGDRRRIYAIHATKAAALTHLRPEEAIHALETAGSFADPGSVDWLDAEVVRLRMVRRQGRLDEALRGFDAVLARPTLHALDRVVVAADRALALAKLGRDDEARQAAAAVDRDLRGLDPPAPAVTADFIRSMLAAARLDPAPAPPR